MAHYKLLKDSPEAPKGALLHPDLKEGHRIYRSHQHDCYFGYEVVENNPEWFEEVAVIAVKAENAAFLKFIDGLAEAGDLPDAEEVKELAGREQEIKDFLFEKEEKSATQRLEEAQEELERKIIEELKRRDQLPQPFRPITPSLRLR